MRTNQPTRRTTIHTVAIVTVMITSSHLAGCTANTTKRDFYAMRSVRLGAAAGDATVIVRAKQDDLLTRERRALALGTAQK